MNPRSRAGPENAMFFLCCCRLITDFQHLQLYLRTLRLMRGPSLTWTHQPTLIRTWIHLNRRGQLDVELSALSRRPPRNKLLGTLSLWSFTRTSCILNTPNYVRSLSANRTLRKHLISFRSSDDYGSEKFNRHGESIMGRRCGLGRRK